MMWNYIHGCLLSGCTLVLYDGSPAYPDITTLWKLADEEELHHFGTSASFIMTNISQRVTPIRIANFDRLRSISVTGSPLPAEGFQWVYEFVKHDVWLVSMSGGTDVCSAFIGGNPTWPVFAGEIQCRALGCNLEAFDEAGRPVRHDVGEMVILKAMPSMPVFFWNDFEKGRYRESYFEMYPGVWRHGDWIRITDNNGIVVLGRSDATLNRGGVRIGTSEVYSALTAVTEVKDALIVSIEKAEGKFWMPLFVIMHDGIDLTDDIKQKINGSLRNTYSPRHVPDEIIAVGDIPFTLSGKKSEMPVKKILLGIEPSRAANSAVLRNPDSLNFFIDLARARSAGSRHAT
jgi:acetoacetyl-CoA synthetase